MLDKLLLMIIKAKNLKELDEITAKIDILYQDEKISWYNHELLFDLIVKVSNGQRWRANVPIIKE